MWEICMPIIKSLAPLVLEENEVTDRRTGKGYHTVFGAIHRQKFKTPAWLHSGGIENNRVFHQYFPLIQ